MRGCAKVFGALLVLGILIKIWPVLLLIAVIALIVGGVRRHKNKAAQARDAEHAEQIKTHRAALSYWQTQASESDPGSAARRAAEDLAEYNKQCLGDLGQQV